MTLAEMVGMARSRAEDVVCRARVVAIGFDRRGDFLGIATNSPRINCKGGGLHAEIALLRKYGPKIHSLILCRFGHSGIPRPIEPCEACRRVLTKKGIKVSILKGEA